MQMTKAALRRLEPAAVYRLYDASGALLYIGSSGNPDARFARHRRDRPWWGEVDRRDLTWFPNRSQAYRAEIEAIWAEGAKYNVMGSEEYGESVSARQKPHAADQQMKCRVAYRANLLRLSVSTKLQACGASYGDARRAGFLAERAYKEASGAFPNGVAYPPLEWLAT